MKLLIAISFSTLFISSCGQKSGKKMLDFGAFKMEVPSDWTKIELRGLDSYLGGITNGNDSLIFDYGWYSYNFKSEDPQLYNYSTDTVNGKAAVIIRPIESGKGILGIYIEKVKGNNHFNLIGRNIKNEEVVIDIFKTIHFKDSKSDHVSSNFAKNVEPLTENKPNGKLFDNNCGACHLKNNKSLTGPGLIEMTKLSFDSWMTDSVALTDSTIKDFASGPSFHRKLGKGLSLEEFSNLREMFQ